MCIRDSDNTKEYEATVVGSDTYSDLAVLKISRDDPFEYATLGDSDTVRVGQDICVLGNPKQLLNSLTKGIVSGLGRASASNSAYGTSTIQIDAAINSGNSGGGLFDMYGNVIGIIDYKLVSNTSASIDNIGFAITCLLYTSKMLMDGMSEYGDPLPKQYNPKPEKQTEEESK